MAMKRKYTKPMIAAIGLIAIVVTLIFLSGTSSGRQPSNALWLSNFVGDEVVVTFINAPPGIEQETKGTLMDAELPGIVLKLGKDETFFSYSNIICVEPSHK